MKFNMRVTVIVCLTLLFKFQISAQDNIEKVDTAEFYAAEFMPVLIMEDKEYNLDDISDYIQQNIEYPDNEHECVGKVIISFYVEKDGTISNLKYERKLCPEIDKKSMEIIKSMKTWKPAMNLGKPVRFKLIFPVIWKIE